MDDCSGRRVTAALCRWLFLSSPCLYIAATVVVSACFFPTLGHAQNIYRVDQVLPDTGIRRVDLIYLKGERRGKALGKQTCVALTGWRWETLGIPFVVNPTNTQGLPQDFIVNSVVAAAATWNDAAKKEIFDLNPGVDTTVTLAQDFVNTISTTDLSSPEVIAFASLYFTSENPQVFEFDIQFNSKVAFGDASNDASVFDFLAVITHEFGHVIGFDHVFDTECSDATMFFESGPGNIDARTLEKGEIKAVRKLYRR